MEYKDIFDVANTLIALLGGVDSYDFVEYVTEEISNNGYCYEDGYIAFLSNKY